VKEQDMEIRPERRIGDLAAHHPATIRVFQRHGIDFCCGGKRPLKTACDDLGLDLADVTRELHTAIAGPVESEPAWHSGSLQERIDAIVDRYHRPMEEELLRLERMMTRVLRVHGKRRPGLASVAMAFAHLREELKIHMFKEEHVLFPYLKRLQAVAASGGSLVASPFGSIANPIAALEGEHEEVGRAVAELRTRTGDYRPPDDACNTFRGLFLGLAELERDLQEHIHIENNILFPEAARMEAELLDCARPHA
jgi:regulator of cell morphogenesis and NO signaling